MLAKTKVATAGGGGRQRMTSVERRAAIIEAAVDLFSQNGFRGTTTRELAAAVGVSEPVLYQHFATKKDLYLAIVEHMLEHITNRFESRLEELPDGATDEQYFRWLVSQMWDWYAEDMRYVRLLLLSALEGHELADLWHERALGILLEHVCRVVDSRMEAGEFREMHPMLATEALLGPVAHVCMMTMLLGCKLPGITKEAVVKEFVDIYLNGIRVRS
jgi:AcrR family transcriptional regulator